MNVVNKILKPLGARLNKASSLNKEKEYYVNTIKRLSHFYLDFYSDNVPGINNDISGIVFSKDRAMQLHALLSSYFHYTNNYASLVILFTCSNEQHKRSYEILQKEFCTRPVRFVEENDFASQLKEILANLKTDRIFFMTDDGIFLDHYDLSDCLYFNPFKDIFSLRLGADFEFCYSHNKKQSIPDFTKNTNDNNFRSWVWQDMKDSPDWNYPLSVDATIFLKREIATLVKNISFKSPNSLESQMQLYNNLFIPRNGICYPKTKYVNIPCNIVQNEFDNISTGAWSVDELVKKFSNGERIDWKMLHNYKPRDAQTVKFSFIK